MPFLDLDVIALGLSIPAGWKLRGDDRPEKWLLRRAFEGMVPTEVLWRQKAEFGDGSGAAMALIDQAYVDDDEDRLTGAGNGTANAKSANGKSHGVPEFRSEEEAAYYRIFHAHLGGVSPERTITMFATA